MSNQFLGQVQQFGFQFAPRGWAFCNGQLMSIAQNTALFALLGTTYGGDGVTTFAVPDMRGRIGLHFGQGPGLSNYDQGQASGTESVTLLSTQIPIHPHLLLASSGQTFVATPNGNNFGASESFTNATLDAVMDPTSIGGSGNTQPHENRQPILVINWCIAVEGIFPSRN
ncbi:MAG TPA: tail fiber protein [Pyrinomonadaceae bacterium]|jgi:microcystin-dependent protein|nr:tail fiber protein [Pyrinomonadaceae bacterium]